MKALEILKACRKRGQKRAGGFDLNEAIAELEEAMKPKSCKGCKYETENKYVSVQDETLDCCCVCIRECYDFYEPKEGRDE